MSNEDLAKVATGNQMARTLRAVKGAVYVEVSNAHDTHHIQCVKSDLIMQMEQYGDTPCGFTLEVRNGVNYFGKDYNYA